MNNFGPAELVRILKDQTGIPEDALAEALQSAKSQNIPITKVLLKKKIVSESAFLHACGDLLDLPFEKKLNMENWSEAFTESVPIQFLKKHCMVPLIPKKESGDHEPPHQTVIAVNDPAAVQAVDDLCTLLSLPSFKLVLSTREAILTAVNHFYNTRTDSAQQLVQDMEEDTGILEEITQTADLLDDTSDAPIIRLVNHMISQSVKACASDVHIVPYQDTLKIRYRIDGVLYDLLEPPKWIQSSLITRIKVMADMDIAEKRLPQDSRIEVRIGNRDIDIRISTIPTTFGERLVLRLLDKSSSFLTLSQFGIERETLAHIRRLSRQTSGIVLVTGPTGSGKTTTLYAMLAEINTPDINIITVEDPVEYKLEGISQIQVNTKTGLTFAKGLRSIVRQDPDVILIGEIRDRETAEIATQSALTGHLVFSTLHTNDSAGAITRLADIGIEPYLITSSVNAVIAQRLVRLLCPSCKEPYAPDGSQLRRIGLETPTGGQLFRAAGCKKCFYTGYRGRMPIFEILICDQAMKGLILETTDASKIKSLAVRNSMTTLFQDGSRKVLQGLTTIEEVLRVTHA